MNSWLLLSIAAMFLWGLWGFFSKLAANSIRDVDAAIFQVFGSVVVAAIAAFFVRFQFHSKPQGVFYAVLSGTAATLATFFFFAGITRGRSVVVVSISALYPLVTLALGMLFLHETITLKQLLGVGLALGAIILMST